MMSNARASAWPWIAALTFGALLVVSGAMAWPARSGAGKATDAQRPELAYLKQVNGWGVPSDPQLVLLLMSQFANAGRHAEGIEYFESLLHRFGPRLTDPQRALYCSVVASLRAGHAAHVPLLSRLGWIRDTIAMLDQAKRLTHGEAFVPRWMSGVVRVRLPALLGQQTEARADLEWCLTHIDAAPHPGWLREVYAGLSKLQADQGRADEGARLAEQAGLGQDIGDVIMTTPFAEETKTGHAFSARAIKEVVPGMVYALSGFEFTEYYFVVSADRRELVAIDAGTRPDAARQAHESLIAAIPGLPPVTTVLVTHAHWDHVGGHRYFRELPSRPRFIGHADFKRELVRDAQASPELLTRFFGRDFNRDDVLSYRPDVAIDRPTRLVVGGTTFELIPTRGGETDDALLIHLPAAGVLFAGDAFMPYAGAPFLEEGSLDGMIAAIDQVRDLRPPLLLHGHEPLNRLFASTDMLVSLKDQLLWLQHEVLQAIARGAERGAIHAANLAPPELSHADSSVHLAYLVLRENLINRVFDQHSGYWGADLTGMDALTLADRAETLVDYLHVTDDQIAAAAQRLIADGKHEQAVELLRLSRQRVATTGRLDPLFRQACLKLMEKYQEFNPFKFIVYSGLIDRASPQMAVPPTAQARP